MAILVIAEHDNTSIKAATLNAVTAATKIGGDIHLLVAGSVCAEAAEAAARIAGVSKVLVADAGHYADQSPENLAALVVANAAAYACLVAGATTIGKNFMPRVAALLDVAQISEIVAVESPDTFVRPIYAGNVVATVRSTRPSGDCRAPSTPGTRHPSRSRRASARAARRSRSPTASSTSRTSRCRPAPR